MQRFFDIEQALDHDAKTLIPARHNYIVNIFNPDDVEASDKTAPQVTAHHVKFRDGDPGFMIALPFAASSREYQSLAQTLGLDLAPRVSEGELDGVPRAFLNLGSDARLAARVVLFLLEHIAGYKPGTQYLCVVHDEGPI